MTPMSSAYFTWLSIGVAVHFMFLTALYDPLRVHLTKRLNSLGWNRRSTSSTEKATSKTRSDGANNSVIRTTTKNRTLNNDSVTEMVAPRRDQQQSSVVELEEQPEPQPQPTRPPQPHQQQQQGGQHLRDSEQEAEYQRVLQGGCTALWDSVKTICRKDPMDGLVFFFAAVATIVLVPPFFITSESTILHLLDISDIAVTLIFVVRIERTLRRLHAKLRNMAIPLHVTRLCGVLAFLDLMQHVIFAFNDKIDPDLKITSEVIETIIYFFFFVFKLWTELAITAARKRDSMMALSTWRTVFKSKPWELLTYALLATNEIPSFYDQNSVSLELMVMSYDAALLIRILLYRDSRVKRGNKGGSSRSSTEEVDIDSLMVVLRSKKGFALFSEYLQRSHCSESGLFYQDVEIFKDKVWTVVNKTQQLERSATRKDLLNSPMAAPKQAPDAYMAEQLLVLGQEVLLIYHDYIREHADKQINIGSGIREKIALQVELVRNSLIGHSPTNSLKHSPNTSPVTTPARERREHTTVAGAETVEADRERDRSGTAAYNDVDKVVLREEDIEAPPSPSQSILSGTGHQSTAPNTPNRVAGAATTTAAGWWERRRPADEDIAEVAAYQRVAHLYTLFDGAYNEILKMMSRDVFSRFCSTEEYDDFCNELKVYEMREKELANVDVC